jgi:hypothetical protein
MIQTEHRIHFKPGARGKRQARSGVRPLIPAGRIPKVARLMALAIRMDQLLRDGVVKDQAELARLGHVSRARLTQIMNLLQLAPDIQEEILHLPESTAGKPPLTERDLRPIAAVFSWKLQRPMWSNVQTEPRIQAPRRKRSESRTRGSGNSH